MAVDVVAVAGGGAGGAVAAGFDDPVHDTSAANSPPSVAKRTVKERVAATATEMVFVADMMTRACTRMRCKTSVTTAAVENVGGTVSRQGYFVPKILSPASPRPGTM